MQTILRKRIWRELRENALRYGALAALIILGMYIIVSMVGASETIITGVEENGEKSGLEDGQFHVFVPLTDEEIRKLEEKGITVEAMFYLDFECEDKSILRMFKNREVINKVVLDEGRMPKTAEEAVIEKRYGEEHGLKTGDIIEIGDSKFKIVGTGSAPDYDAVFQKLSDSSADSEAFGLIFVKEEAYEEIRKTGKSVKTEEYIYAYHLNGTMTDEELKNELKNMDFDADEVEDSYFQEYWEETGGQRSELEEGIKELAGGAEELRGGLNEMKGHKEELAGGAGEIFNSYLEETESGLAEYGLEETLSADNYEEVLGRVKAETDSAVFRLKISAIIDQLNELNSYKEGISEYTKGMDEAAGGAEELAEGIKELQEETNELIERYIDIEISNLTQFITAGDNPRIKASAEDQVINKVAGLIAGVIVMILFTYVISVFVIHGIEQESNIIGTLYALGVKRGELLMHYLMLPVCITFFSGIAGTVLGFSRWGVNVQMQDCYHYFSIPVFEKVYPVYLLIYGIAMPPLTAALVNCFVIHKRLSQPVLQLIRKEQKKRKISNIKLGKLGFIGRFRVRQMLGEIRTGFTVLFGMFISLLIMMLGINCYVLCENIRIETRADTKYEYMYTYKYPEKTVPEGGEPCYAHTLKKEIFGYNLDVTLFGIGEANPYFDAAVTAGKNKVIISSAMAQKYQLSTGDELILADEENDINYVFDIEGVTQYSPGLYVFMEIGSMRELLGTDEDYYNVILSDRSLPIDQGRLYAATSKTEISKSAEVFVQLMKPMVYMLTGVSVTIFVVVMYLMIKMMIDRSAQNIALVKIFGYRTGEIRKLYLNGNFYIVAVGAAVCIPLSKHLMDAMYPVLISNIGCAMNLTFSRQLYMGIYAAIIVLYLIINQMLVGKVKKMKPVEVLKNRE